jgi:hypothetical protein
MKKRKTPVLLVSILVVMVGVFVAYASSLNKSDAPQTPDGPLTQTHDAPSSDNVKSEVSNSLKGMPGQPGSAPTQPSIAVRPPSLHYTKPKPDANGSTDSQWYNH